MKKTWLAALVLLGLALAHHGWSSYDASREFQTTGTITEITFEFPHATIWIKGRGFRLPSSRNPPGNFRGQAAVFGWLEPDFNLPSRFIGQ